MTTAIPIDEGHSAEVCWGCDILRDLESDPNGPTKSHTHVIVRIYESDGLFQGFL